MNSTIKPSIIFFGNERIATGLGTDTPTIRALIDDGYTIEAVISSQAVTKNRSRSKRALEIETFAKERGIPFHAPTSAKELFALTTACTSDIAILVAYGRMIPQNVIDQFPLGIINIHPSLLPLHRGPTPIESTILNGDAKTGVSIMQLQLAMDAGPVYTQTNCVLTGMETKTQLGQALIDQGIAALLETLPSILDGSNTGTPQDDSKATYDKQINKADGVIDWSDDAQHIAREIRAYDAWPRSRTNIAGMDVAVTKAHVMPCTTPRNALGHVEVIDKPGAIAIECGDGNYICIEALIPAGKKEMSIDAFLKGHRSKIQ